MDAKKQETRIEHMVNILRDSKQMRIVIPKEIIDKCNISPERFSFRWTLIQDGDNILVSGGFIPKNNEKKTN